MSGTGVLAHFGLPILVSSCGSADDHSSAGIGSNSSNVSGGSAARLYPRYNTSPPDPVSSGTQNTAVQIASQITLGRNLGNTMEVLGGKTAWGNFMISSGLMELAKDSGFDAVRIALEQQQNVASSKYKGACIRT